MDEEVQTRLLLGDDREAIERDLEADDSETAAPVSDLRGTLPRQLGCSTTRLPSSWVPSAERSMQ